MKNKIFQKLNNKSFYATFFALFVWALFITLFSLALCAKTSVESMCVFASYFYKPLIILLNFIPAFFMCVFFYFVFGTVYLSGVISSAIVFIMLYINEIKIIFRNDVFTAVDLTLVSEAMNMAERYKPFFDWYYAFVVVLVVAGAYLSKRFFKSEFKKIFAFCGCNSFDFFACRLGLTCLYRQEDLRQDRKHGKMQGFYECFQRKRPVCVKRIYIFLSSLLWRYF